MSYLNPDGSTLIGGLLPNGQGQALKLDNLGMLHMSQIGDARSEQCYIASIGPLVAAADTNAYPLSIFNPDDSGKNILIYSIQVMNGSGSLTAFVKHTTTDPEFDNPAIVNNAILGGAASAIANSITTVDTNQSHTGPYIMVANTTSNTIELLTNSATILLPEGEANGITIYIETYTAGYNSITVHYMEYES